MKTFLIDLDGVLNDYNGNFDENTIPKMKAGAKEFLTELSKYGELYLHTTRNLKLSVKWLIENNLDIFFKDVINIKIPCYLHIDDRAICFKGNYKDTLNEIENFRVYYKNVRNKK